jgi:hypothetical protein
MGALAEDSMDAAASAADPVDSHTFSIDAAAGSDKNGASGLQSHDGKIHRLLRREGLIEPI